MKTSVSLLLFQLLAVVSLLLAVVDIGRGLCDANFPTTPDGRTYHLEVKEGDVANRIVTVGDLERAETYAGFLDTDSVRFRRISKRGFVVITGTFQGVPLTIIGTGMGTPMIDFTIRETRAVVTGKMAMIRIGTCGSPAPEVALGDVVVNNASVFIRRDPDLYRSPAAPMPYTISKPVFPSPVLTSMLKSELESLSGMAVHVGMGATADSFYSSQGRITNGFHDRNEALIDALVHTHPILKSIEMETFHLLDLASPEVSRGEMHAAAAMLVIAQRFSDEFIDPDKLKMLERQMGVAALTAVAKFEFTA